MCEQDEEENDYGQHDAAYYYYYYYYYWRYNLTEFSSLYGSSLHSFLQVFAPCVFVWWLIAE